MLNIGPAELLVVLVVALLVLGPNKLPDAARQVGKAIGEMRKLSTGFQAEMRDAMREPVEGRPRPGANKATPAKSGGSLASPRPPAAGEVPDPAPGPTGEGPAPAAEPGTTGTTST